MPGVTLKDVAAACGFSLATVAFIMRGHPKPFPEATRSAVLAAAEKLGYRANASARATRSGRHRAFALVQVADRCQGDLHPITLDSLVQAAEAGGDHMLITRLPAAAFTQPTAAPRILQELVVDGLLISYHTGVPRDFAAAVQAQRIPAVWINSRQSLSSVGLDDVGAAVLAIDHLVALGHERIAYLNLWHDPNRRVSELHSSMGERLQGYRSAMRRHDLPTQEILGGAAEPATDRAIAALMSGANRPTAVLCFSAMMTHPVFMAAARLGYAVPDDLSVMVFSEHPEFFGGLALTTVHGAYVEMGAAAVTMLRTLVADPARPQPSITLPSSLIVAQSVTAVSRSRK